MKAMTFPEFEAKIKEIHGDRFRWHSLSWVNASTEVWGNCPIHGDFSAMPNNIARGSGCGACGSDNRQRVWTMKTTAKIKSKQDARKVMLERKKRAQAIARKRISGARKRKQEERRARYEVEAARTQQERAARVMANKVKRRAETERRRAKKRAEIEALRLKAKAAREKAAKIAADKITAAEKAAATRRLIDSVSLTNPSMVLNTMSIGRNSNE